MKQLKASLYVATALAVTSFNVQAYCVCNTYPLEMLISQVTNPTLSQINASVINVGTDVGRRVSAVEAAVNANRTSVEKGIAQSVTLSDYEVNEARNTAQQQAAVLGDMEAVRRTRESKHPNACGAANAQERVGKGAVTGSYTSAAMMGRRKQDANGVTNPVQAIQAINSLQEKDRTPEFVGSDAGTMSEDDRVSYLNFMKVLMPTPPRAPTSLPTQFKSTPKAQEYESEFKKYEAAALYFDKLFMRDGVMGSPTIEVTSEQLDLWKQITGSAALPAELLHTAKGKTSSFPDHWGTLDPTTIKGRKFISERDYLRTEVFRRYGNPYYQSDEKYGLASFTTAEGLLKELIMMVAVQNRMVYEIMNSQLHAKQLAAVEGAWRNDETFGERLRRLEAAVQRN